MNKIFYRVYCKGILGVKTNVDNFRWIYGSVAPEVSFEEYKECLIKFDICVKPERELRQVTDYEKKFQLYLWDEKNKTISCRRTLFRNFEIGFDLRIVEDTVFAEIGRHYYKYIKNRMMNLHGMYYLLSDLANVMLLKRGLLTLYASSVHNNVSNKCAVYFASPNTGKTVIATKLCELPNYRFVGEDIVITDGQNVYSCPWTSSYRKNSRSLDNAGALGRIHKGTNKNINEVCKLTDLVVLSLGKKNVSRDKRDIYKAICILNGYLFGYYSTPIIKIMAYFDDEYCKSWNERAELMFKDMVEKNDCHMIQAETAMEFLEHARF